MATSGMSLPEGFTYKHDLISPETLLFLHGLPIHQWSYHPTHQEIIDVVMARMEGDVRRSAEVKMPPTVADVSWKDLPDFLELKDEKET